MWAKVLLFVHASDATFVSCSSSLSRHRDCLQVCFASLRLQVLAFCKHLSQSLPLCALQCQHSAAASVMLGLTCAPGLQEAASAAHQTAVRHCCSSPGGGAPQRHDCGHCLEVKAGTAHLQHCLAAQGCSPGEALQTITTITISLLQPPAADAEQSGLWLASLPA